MHPYKKEKAGQRHTHRIKDKRRMNVRVGNGNTALTEVSGNHQKPREAGPSVSFSENMVLTISQFG